jgi:hypothetical protein
MKIATLAVLAAVFGMPAMANDAKTYAQALVDKAMANNGGLAGLTLYATPPKQSKEVAIASHAGKGYEVKLPLLDANRRTIGTADFTFRADEDHAAADKKAEAIRDDLARHISHIGNLMEKAVFDPSLRLDSYAQWLVDQTLAKHPSLVILALHAPKPDYPIVGSNIGRIGKKADEDDMHVITSGETKLEFNETKDRYEVEQALLDQSGAIIGAVGCVFPYKEGDDLAVRQAEAKAILNELKAQIPNAAKLTEAASPLKKLSFTELKGYDGDFDHIFADLKGNRLLLAAEDHGTLELFSLDKVKHLKTIKGVETPHAFLPVPNSNLLVVTDSGKGGTKLYDWNKLEPKGTLKNLGLGADSMEYDPISKHAFINTGGKDAEMTEAFMEEVDPLSGDVLAKVKFASNSLQSLAVDPDGSRVFVMDQGNNKIVTVDRKTHQITHQWDVKDVGQAAMVQYDAAHHRLFVGTRKPGKLIVVDSETGATVASFAAPEKTDQLIYDKGTGRIYMLGGEGKIGIWQQNGADSYAELPRVTTVEGAKTGLLVPELHRLFVAVSPGEGKTSGGGILQYAVE